MSVKDEKVSFSDQITSRLHRWVQRTTSKVRNERSQSVKIRENKNIIKENEMDKKCPPRENFARRSRESRSYEELEKALKDLMNNCVSSDSVIQEGSLITHDNANINITMENNNNDELSPTNKTTNDVETGFNDQFDEKLDNVEEDASPSGRNSLQERENNSCERHLESLPHTKIHYYPHRQSKQTEDTSNEKGKIALEEYKDDEIYESLSTSGDNEKDCEHETRFDEDFNRLSKSSETCGINTSFSKVNKGLNTPIDGSILKEHCAQNSARTLNKKPPLRRIQSEGDALELKLSFEDSDVSEFAATCVRHAQKKRFSDTAPDVYRSTHLTSFLTGGTTNDDSPKCSISEVDVLVAENTEVFEHVQTIPEICLHEETTKPNHIPLSDRPSSLSFPLETPRRKNKSSLKPKVSSSLPRSVTSLPRSVPGPPQSCPSPSRLTPSPKFRRFPCQPVFYVPEPTESGTVRRGGSVGEQSKEYLI